MHRPLLLGQSSIVRFTMPDFCTISQMKSFRALQSPFLDNDKRSKEYEAYKTLGENAPPQVHKPILNDNHVLLSNAYIPIFNLM